MHSSQSKIYEVVGRRAQRVSCFLSAAVPKFVITLPPLGEQVAPRISKQWLLLNGVVFSPSNATKPPATVVNPWASFSWQDRWKQSHTQWHPLKILVVVSVSVQPRQPHLSSDTSPLIPPSKHPMATGPSNRALLMLEKSMATGAARE